MFTYTYTDDGFVAVIFFAFAVALRVLSITDHTIVLTIALGLCLTELNAGLQVQLVQTV